MNHGAHHDESLVKGAPGMFGTMHSRRGSAASAVIVVIVLIALAGGLWYFVLRSTPTKTVTSLLEAARMGDAQMMANYLTEDSSGEGDLVIGLTRRLTGDATGEPEYTVGEAEITENRAVVPVQFPVEGMISTLTGMETFTLPYVLNREGRTWLVDTNETQQEIGNRVAGGALEMFRRFISPGESTDGQEPGERHI